MVFVKFFEGIFILKIFRYGFLIICMVDIKDNRELDISFKYYWVY